MHNFAIGIPDEGYKVRRTGSHLSATSYHTWKLSWLASDTLRGMGDSSLSAFFGDDFDFF